MGHGTTSFHNASVLGAVAVVAFVALSAYALLDGAYVVLFVSWVAFVGMLGFAVVGARNGSGNPLGLVWGYGISAGAMITSASAFIVPQAIAQDPKYGGFGIAAGIAVGFFAHTVGHELSHRDLPLDTTTAQIAAHALTAGAVIGVIYGSLDLGPLLGLAIVSHKGPAGYAAARRLSRRGRPLTMLLLPAAGVGIAAITASELALPTTPVVRALVFGFAAGIFLHVAMDFLPRCEVGSEVHEVAELDGHDHDVLDTLRVHAVASVLLGGLAVFGAWLVVA